MALIPNLPKTSRQNLELLYESLKKSGITNKFTQAGILAVCAKESGFTLRAEYDYSTTGIARIRQIFGMKDFTDRQIDRLKKDPEEWFDYLYGGKYENSTANRKFKTIDKTLPRSEGYKYRGRGFNQVTFKTLYKQLLPFADGKDIVKNPDLMLEPKVAASVLVGFFLKNFKDFPNILRAWNMKDKNDAKNLTEGVGVPFHLTGGVGYTRAQVVALGEQIGSWPKSLEYVKEFYDWILRKEGEQPDPAAFTESETPVDPRTSTTAASGGSLNAPAEGDSQSRSERGSSRSNSSGATDTSAPNIRNIVEAKRKAKQISFELPPQKDQQQEIALNFGKIPMIWYNSYQIKPSDIQFINLSTVGIIPTLKITFTDTYNLMKDKAFPLDDTKISIFINTLNENLKPIHLDFKITKFSVNKKVYNITGVIDVGELYVKKFSSISKKTSFNALKTIAEQFGLGFNSNIDDTDDEMTWINTGERLYEFIEKIVDMSYKSDEAFLVSYIDYFYGLNFIELEKELNRDLKAELGIPSIGITDVLKIKDKDKVSRLFLTNDRSMETSNSYFTSYKIVNLSTAVSLQEGYLTKVKYYDELQKSFLIFDVDSISSKGDSTIILKGNPSDENFYNENVNLIYKGKLDTDNMHKNYLYSWVQNIRNITELEKIGLEITMGNANYNLIRFQKVSLVLSNQHSTPSASHINNRLSGEWLVIDISYRFDGKTYTQIVKLVKRELELSKEELDKEGTSPSRKSTENQGDRTANENPTTTENEQTVGTTQSGLTQSGLTTSTAAQAIPPSEDTSNMKFNVPPLPKKDDRSSPSGFPIRLTAFKKQVRTPNQIIIHYTAGWQILDKSAGTIDFLMNGRKDFPNGLSYHYIISVDGHIECLVDPQYLAKHSGQSVDDNSIGISLSSLGTTFDGEGFVGANKQVNSLRSNPLYAKNEDYAKLVDFNGKEKKYRNFTACQEVSVAQIAALETLLKYLKNRFPSLPSYNGLTQEHFDILFPPPGSRSGSYGCPAWKVGVPNIYSHCSITNQKVDIAPTPRLINFFKRLRL
jgi:predicted chitinase/N-acetyl-anhydromuramyl-L-alanine amidase AmpD